jgi:hypothetical protein
VHRLNFKEVPPDFWVTILARPAVVCSSLGSIYYKDSQQLLHTPLLHCRLSGRELRLDFQVTIYAAALVLFSCLLT